MNELKVSLENIIPLTFARDHFSQIVSEVQKDKLFVLTKGGKPVVAIIDAKYLESLTGGQIQKADIKEEIKKAPEKVGLPPMVEHPSTGPSKPITPSPAPQPRADQPRVEKPIVPPPPPAKPAGFAAPQPKPAPLPQPTPPPPPIPKPEPKPTPPPPPPQPRADQPRVEKPEPAKGPGLVMPKEKSQESSGIPNKPLKTLPPVGQTNQVNVEFAPDEATLAKQTAEDKKSDFEKAAPDDKNPPAQYAGEENPPASGEPEPEDMALD